MVVGVVLWKTYWILIDIGFIGCANGSVTMAPREVCRSSSKLEVPRDGTLVGRRYYCLSRFSR